MIATEQLQQQRRDAQRTLSAIEHALMQQVTDGAPQWRDLGLPVVDRGTHAIFPLAAAAATEGGDSDDEKRLSELHFELWREWGFRYGGHDYRVGRFDDEDEYGQKLAAAGAHGRGPYWWSVKYFAVVVVHSFDQHRAFDTLALHVIPRDWARYVSRFPGSNREASHNRRVKRELHAADVGWSWPPVSATWGGASTAP